MIEQIQHIEETEWGLDVILRQGGTIDDTNVIPTIKHILDHCKALGKYSVLIDATMIIRRVSVVTFLDVAKMIQNECPGIKIAFIAPQLADNTNSKSMETFAVNRGAFVQYFHDKDSAMAWLLKPDHPA